MEPLDKLLKCLLFFWHFTGGNGSQNSENIEAISTIFENLSENLSKIPVEELELTPQSLQLDSPNGFSFSLSISPPFSSLTFIFHSNLPPLHSSPCPFTPFQSLSILA